MSQSQSSTGDLGDITGIEGQSGKEMCQGGKPDTAKLHPSYIGMNVYGSARMCVTAAATYTNNCYIIPLKVNNIILKPKPFNNSYDFLMITPHDR